VKGLYATGNVDLAYRKSQQASQCRNIGIAITSFFFVLQIMLRSAAASGGGYGG
jgi:hypothetical protein